MNFPFNERKALAAVLFVIQQFGGKINKHKLVKILYFADKKHLVKYMRPVFGDSYIAMENGPVPSYVYDGIKGSDRYPLFQYALKSDKKFVMSSEGPNMKVLSRTDIECLTESVRENRNLSFADLVRKSHAYAYDHAILNRPISILDMAKEEGASQEALEYIQDLMSDYCLSDS